MMSAASALGPHAVGVMLTGMGKDGSQGLLAMRQAGARTLNQDEKSSVVYGMPRAAWEVGASEMQVSLDRVAESVIRLLHKKEELV